MKTKRVRIGWLTYLCLLFFPILAQSQEPNDVFVFTSPIGTTQTVSPTGAVQVQYTVGVKKHPHTMMMESIPGVSYTFTANGSGGTPAAAGQQCIIANPSQTCILTLNVMGSQIGAGGVHGGPTVCVVVNGQCSPFGSPTAPKPPYQLNISVSSGQEMVTGLQNGSVYYSLNHGVSWTSTATNPSDDTTPVLRVFLTSNALYAASQNAYVYSSPDNGASWSIVGGGAVPGGDPVVGLYVLGINRVYASTSSNAIYLSNAGGSWAALPTAPCTINEYARSIFVYDENHLYAGCTDGQVTYSSNSGNAWSNLNGVTPDGGTVPITDIWVGNSLLYVGTANENVYTNTNWNNVSSAPAWVWYAQTVYSLFVDLSATNILAGTQGGYVYSLSTGDVLGFIVNSQVNSVFSTF